MKLSRPKLGSPASGGGLKPPAALVGVYRELRGQHLLAIVVLLIAALIAVPIMIGSKSGSHEIAVAPIQAPESSSGSSELSVSKWTPGILDYKKSLDGSKPDDPFAATAVGAKEEAEKGSGKEGESSGEGGGATEGTESSSEGEGGGAGGGSEASPVETVPTPTETGSSPEPRESSGSEGSSGSGSGKKRETKAEEEEAEKAITADFQVTMVHQDGGIDKSPIRREVPQLTKLPNIANPALTYAGPSGDGTKALMQVAPEVTAMIGDSKCVAHGNPCGLLALEVATPETVVFGPKGFTYRIELVRIGDEGFFAAKKKARKHHPKTGGGGSGNGPAPRGIEAEIGVGGNRIVGRLARGGF